MQIGSVTPIASASLGATNTVVLPMTALPVPARPRVRDKNKKTPQDVFEEMKRNFSEKKAQGVNLTFQWKLTGKNPGTWFLKVNDGKFTIGKGETTGADVTFHCTSETWVALSNEKLSGTRAFLSGKKLDEIFPA
jgi:putative sterol carrier protein